MKKRKSKTIVLGVFKIWKYTFFNFWKTGQAKNEIFVSVLSLILEKTGQAQNLCYIFWKFVRILFLILKKGAKHKNCARFF